MQSIDCSIDAEAMKDLPENIKCFVADVADSDQVDAMFEQILPGQYHFMSSAIARKSCLWQSSTRHYFP